jgi:hypothetical protein
MGYTPASMEKTDIRAFATDAVKFWEPWRLFYNLILAAIVIIYFAIGIPLVEGRHFSRFLFGIIFVGGLGQCRVLCGLSSLSS